MAPNSSVEHVPLPHTENGANKVRNGVSSTLKSYANQVSNPKALKCQFRALVFLLFHVAAIPFWAVITALLVLRAKFFTKTVEAPKVEEKKRRKVLVNGSPMTKSLHVVRILGRAGHEVILADSETFRSNGAQHSKYVSKFVRLPDFASEEGRQAYVDALVKVAKEEEVDWFVPVSHTKTSVPDTIAAERLRDLGVKCLVFDAPETTEMLDDKVIFLEECRAMDLPVPGFFSVSNVAEVMGLREQGVFTDTHYFLKPLTPYSEERENFTRIPAGAEACEEFLRDYAAKIRPTNPYFVCQFVRGKEFASNAVCAGGRVLAIQVVPSSPTQIDYDAVSHPEIEAWTSRFIREKGLSGTVCFDFLEDAETKNVYCIECNPRLHSAIAAFHYDPDLEVAIRAGLEPESVTSEEQARLPVRPRPGLPHVYWLYNEMAKVLRRELEVRKFLSIVMGGKEAVYEDDDPSPFAWSNTAQLIDLLWQRMWTGEVWSFVNPCMGQLRS